MKTLLASAALALGLAVAAVPVATPAAAQDVRFGIHVGGRHHGYWRHRHHERYCHGWYWHHHHRSCRHWGY